MSKHIMPKLIPIKPKLLIAILLALGFQQRDAEGSHIFLKHPDSRTTVIAVHNKEISKGLLRKVLNDVKLSVDEYDRLRK